MLLSVNFAVLSFTRDIYCEYDRRDSPLSSLSHLSFLSISTAFPSPSNLFGYCSIAKITWQSISRGIGTLHGISNMRLSLTILDSLS